jgi:alanyl-tRNA synthetase
VGRIDCNRGKVIIMKATPEIDSAMHVVKGAVQKVLGASLTIGVYGEGNKGRLTVEYCEKPSDEQINDIEDLSNKKITENFPIKTFEMDRTRAENGFGNVIYDKFPVPSHVKILTIVQIEDWNINCCTGNHVKTTGEIGQIHILHYRSRPNRKELEISFEIVKNE